MEELITKLKQLVVDALMLEDIAAEDIGTDDAIFGDGLGLDSIDALELVMAIDREYGVRIEADNKNNADNKVIFASIRNLAEHIAEHRAQ